jgi:hypothetical protein
VTFPLPEGLGFLTKLRQAVVEWASHEDSPELREALTKLAHAADEAMVVLMRVQASREHR